MNRVLNLLVPCCLVTGDPQVRLSGGVQALLLLTRAIHILTNGAEDVRVGAAPDGALIGGVAGRGTEEKVTIGIMITVMTY